MPGEQLTPQTYTVKALEWVSFGPEMYTAMGIFETVYVIRLCVPPPPQRGRPRKHKTMTLGWFTTAEDGTPPHPCDSIEAAKAAAEAHYLSRLLPALSPATESEVKK